MEKILLNLGFSPSESRVYLHLLEKGCSYANKISSETKVNRTNVYEALDRLISKGVISFITRNKVKWFEAKSSDYLRTLIKEKEEEFQEDKKQVFDYLNKLKKLGPDSKSLEANVFVGRKGLRMIFEDMLETKKPISLLGASKVPFKIFFGPYFELWHKRRIENNISQRSIFPERVKNNLLEFKRKLKKINKKTLIEYKFIDDKFMSPAATFIYGDKSVSIQWSKEPIAIKIKNKEIAKSHLNYFNMLWNS